jgi:hypothetical protein
MPAEEVIGYTPMELGLWSDLDEFSRLVQSLQEEGSLRDMEIRLRTKLERFVQQIHWPLQMVI